MTRPADPAFRSPMDAEILMFLVSVTTVAPSHEIRAEHPPGGESRGDLRRRADRGPGVGAVP